MEEAGAIAPGYKRYKIVDGLSKRLPVLAKRIKIKIKKDFII
jgi:hypothetical protein